MTRIVLLLFLILATSLVIFNCFDEVAQTDKQGSANSWEILTENPISPTVSTASTIFFFDEKKGIVGDVFQIQQTSDGGKTWRFINKFDQKSIQSYLFTKHNIGWAVGSETNSDKQKKPVLLNSKDEGVSWHQVDIEKNDSANQIKEFTVFYDICLNSLKSGWIVGNAGMFEVVIDNQEMKVTNLLKTDEEIFSVACNQKGEAWGVGENGSIYHYQNESKKKHLDKQYFFTKVKQKDNTMWVLGYKRLTTEDKISAILLRSKDNGESWEDKSPENTRFFSDIHLNNGIGWLVGSDGKIYYSSNNGDTWKNIKSPTRNNLHQIYFLNEKNIWISGINQTILKYKPN